VQQRGPCHSSITAQYDEETLAATPSDEGEIVVETLATTQYDEDNVPILPPDENKPMALQGEHAHAAMRHEVEGIAAALQQEQELAAAERDADDTRFKDKVAKEVSEDKPEMEERFRQLDTLLNQSKVCPRSFLLLLD